MEQLLTNQPKEAILTLLMENLRPSPFRRLVSNIPVVELRALQTVSKSGKQVIADIVVPNQQRVRGPIYPSAIIKALAKSVKTRVLSHNLEELRCLFSRNSEN